MENSLLMHQQGSTESFQLGEKIIEASNLLQSLKCIHKVKVNVVFNLINRVFFFLFFVSLIIA